MTTYIDKSDLRIATELNDLLQVEILPGLGLDADQVWKDFSILINALAPVNRGLLNKRDDIQQQVDEWHRAHPGSIQDTDAYKNFLTSIGYLIPEGEDFTINTKNVDDIPGMEMTLGEEIIGVVDRLTNPRDVYAINLEKDGLILPSRLVQIRHLV